MVASSSAAAAANNTFSLLLTPENNSYLQNGNITEVEFDIHDYLASVYGPQRQPPEKLIPLTVIYIGKIDHDKGRTKVVYQARGVRLLANTMIG